MKRGRVMLSERDKQCLTEFRACRVPRKYFELDSNGGRFDFNFNYEEIFEYADMLLHGEEIDARRNHLGLPARALDEEFGKVLEVVGRRDPTLEEFCDKFMAAIAVVRRAARS